MKTYPCPLCEAKAAEVLQAEYRDGPASLRAEGIASLAVSLSTSDTPRARAEHMARVHGWKLP